MSAKNASETKVPEDEVSDFGYQSGPISSQLSSDDFGLDSENFDNDSVKKENENTLDDSDKKVSCESYEFDSGLGISEGLSNVKLSEYTETYQVEAPLIVEPPRNQEIPLSILFQPDQDGDTQLHIAAVHGCKKSVGTLIRICPNKILFDIPNNYGHTPLHLAVMGGHAVVTRMLVIAGASLEARDRTGETPIHKAVNHTKVGKHMDCLQALLAPVSEHPSRKLPMTLKQKNYNGQMCVHLAASAGHLDTLRTLVSHGADINAREGLAGSTALHIAVRRGDTTMAQWLLERCSGLVRSTTDYAGRTPRRLAKRTKLQGLFANSEESEDESDIEDEMYDSDSDSDSYMEKLLQDIQNSQSLINVA